MTTDWTAYQEGFDAWDEYVLYGRRKANPYERETIEWMSYNQGWNTNENCLTY